MELEQKGRRAKRMNSRKDEYKKSEYPKGKDAEQKGGGATRMKSRMERGQKGRREEWQSKR